MPSSISFTGATLQLQSVTPINGGATLKVRFTQDPLQVSSAGAHDALNTANYTLSGPLTIAFTGSSVVGGDPQSIYLTLAAPLTTGTWALTAANITTAAADPLLAPFTIQFSWTAIKSGSVSEGSTNDSAEDVIRKHLSPGIHQWEKGWSSLIAGLAEGDQGNFDVAPLIFDQLYTCTSTGIYLDRRSADNGIIRPDSVGIGDDVFRRLSIKTTAKKLVTQALLEILEVYYGTDSTRAHLISAQSEPFNIQAGWTLTVSIDGGADVTVPFTVNDFAQISVATAKEVAAVITRWLKANDSTAYAVEFVDPNTGGKRVEIFSGALGLESSVQVTGGRAQNVLQFPTLLTQATIADNWVVTKPSPGRARYELDSNSTTTDLTKVYVGDYVNIFGNNFAGVNQGTFQVVAVDVRVVSGTLHQFFEVLNDTPTPQNPVAVVLTSDVMFFRATKTTINDNGARAVIVAQTSPRLVQVQLPATTIAVARTAKSAAYLQVPTTLTPVSIQRDATGTVTVTTNGNHNLSVGNQVFIDGVVPSGAAPATVAGNGTSTTDASLVTIFSGVAAASGNAVQNAQAVTLLDGSVFVTGGLTVVPAVATDTRIFAITGSSTLVGGQTQYTYTWTAKTALPIGRYGHRVTLMADALQNGNVLVTGGRDLTGNALSSAYLYNVAGNTWSGAMTMVVARADHGQVTLNDGSVLLMGGRNPNASTQTATAEVFKSSGLSGTFSSTGSMVTARYKVQAFLTNSGKVVCAGGFTAAGDTAPTSKVEIYDPATLTWTTGPDMTYARADGAVVPLGNDCYMLTGGRGFVASFASATADLASSEIYDARSGRWYPALPMAAARGSPRFAGPVGTRYYFMGRGSTAGAEYFDTATRTWGKVRVLADGVRTGCIVALAGGLPFLFGGTNDGGTTILGTAELLVSASDQISAGNLQGTRAVTAVLSPTSFQYITHSTKLYTLNVGASTAITPFAAPAASPTLPGPYVLDPTSGVAVTNIVSALTAAVAAGSQYQTIGLTAGTALNFPDAAGWLVLGFGTASQVGPVKYLGRADSNTLIIDFAQKFTVSLPIGTTVTLLSQKGPFDPDKPQQLGVFYLTDSSSGRVAASDSIDAVVAAGIKVVKTVVYPGDHGLGGEGLPASGVDKLSDKVAVWAGNDVDAEVSAARAGN